MGFYRLQGLAILFGSAIAVGLNTFYPGKTVAQVTPDNTLGAESSVVTPNRLIKGTPSDIIDGGATRGQNLFHSFEEFNVDSGRGVFFSNPTGIENILTRVTGNNASKIFGTLGVNGAANLFLLNPNGIVFGKNARLDVDGSFVGSSGSGFVFGDGLEFSATNPQAPPLLEINLIPGLQRVTSGGEITNQGTLAVAPQKNLSLFGGTVTSNGSLTAPGGTVELIGEQVSLFDNALIDVSSGAGGGNVLIGRDFQDKSTTPAAKRIYIGPQVNINADAPNSGNAGIVSLWADEVTGFYGNISAKSGSDAGNGGLVEISGKEQLIFRGNVDVSSLNGITGTLRLNTNNFIIADSGENEEDATTDSFAANNSGVADLILSTSLSQINDAAPATIYESQLEELSGDINLILQATSYIIINDFSDNELKFGVGKGEIAFIADADGDGVGNFVVEDIADTIEANTRNIEISGANLTLGNIDTSSRIEGNHAGSIKLNATGDITTENLDSSYIIYFNSGNVGNGGEITLTAGGNIITKDLESLSILWAGANSGNGGEINLTAGGNITIQELNSYSLALLNYENAGNGAAITITAGGDITAMQDLNSYSLGDAKGNGGSITLTAGGNITTAKDLNSLSSNITSNTGNGGAITLTAGGNITTQSSLQSYANSNDGDVGNGGAITLTAGSNITIQSSLQSISYSRDGNAGNAGEIIISAKDGDIVGISSPTFASVSISENGTAGKGGDVILEAKGNVTDVEILTLSSDSDAGEVQLTGFGDLSLTNTDIITSKQLIIVLPLFSAEEIVLNVGEEGQSGNVFISSEGNLTLNDSRIESDTKGSDPAGNILIASPDIINFNNSKIISDSNSTGAAGSIDVLAGQGIAFIDSNSGISAQASARGNAGNINVETTELNLRDGAQISAETTASGAGGNLTLETEKLALNHGSEVTVSSEASGEAGDLTVNADDSILLDNQSQIRADTTGGGGNISANSPLLILRNGSSITTNANGDNISGGNINIDVKDGFIIAAPNQNSDIRADSANFRGGEVTISNIAGIYGIESRLEPAPLTNDITAKGA